MAATDLDKMATYTLVDDADLVYLDSPTTQVGANSTGSATGISIGFTFNFDGVAYTTIDVFAYGFARLAGTETSATSSNLFASNANVILAPWWDNMKTAETVGYVKTQTQGTAPWRRFIVGWVCYTSSADTAANATTLRFQLVLYETTDKIEMRYAKRAFLGGGGASIDNASAGVKGDTTTITDNWREFAAGYDSLPLGGDNTSAFDGLDDGEYDALVAAGVRVFEPNWPMCGRAFLIARDELTGLNPYGRVFWKIANFSNWLWCKHTPPLLNFSPYMQTGASSVTFVRPVEISQDAAGFDYRVWVQCYASTGANVTVSIDEDALADPQPATGADWSNLVANVQAVSAGWNELTAFDITVSTSSEYLRFVVSVSAGTVLVSSIMVAPVPLDDIDENATGASGWRPMGLHALRQTGAPVFAEWLNRAWANIAYVVNNRRQEVWSSVWPSTETLASTTERPVRTIGVSKAWLPERSQAATARIYARDSTGGAPLTLAENGNARLAEFTVDASGGEYRAQTAAVELLGNLPEIRATCDPVGTMYPHSVAIDWVPSLSTSDLLVGTTPAPKLAYLYAIAARMEKALRLYVQTGQASMMARGKSSTNKWNVQTMVPPAIRALRPHVARDSDDQGQASDETRIYAASSGSGVNDEIIIPSPHPRGRDDYPPEGAIDYAVARNDYDDTPTSARDRLLESPTLTSMSAAVRERVEIVRGVGVTFVPTKADAQTL